MLLLDQVDVERLGELVTDAWRMRAPDEIAGLLEDSVDLSSAESGKPVRARYCG
jgi:hypothetical protein